MNLRILPIFFISFSALQSPNCLASFCSFIGAGPPPVNRAEFEETKSLILSNYSSKSLKDIKLDLRDTPESGLALLDVLIDKYEIPNVSISQFFKSLDSNVDSKKNRDLLRRLSGFIESDLVEECLRLFRSKPVSQSQIEKMFSQLFWITHSDERVIQNIYKNGWQSERFKIEQNRFRLAAAVDGGLKAFQDMELLRQSTPAEEISRLYDKSRTLRKLGSTIALNWLITRLPIPQTIIVPLGLPLEYWRRLHPSEFSELEQLLSQERYDAFKSKLRTYLGIWKVVPNGNVNLAGRAISQFIKFVGSAYYSYFMITESPALTTQAYFALTTRFSDIKQSTQDHFDPKLSRLKLLNSWLDNYAENVLHQPVPMEIIRWKNDYVEGEVKPYPTGHQEICQQIEKKWKFLLNQPDSDFVLH